MDEVHILNVEHKKGDIVLTCQQCERHIEFVKVEGQSSLSLRKIKQGDFYARHEVDACHQMFNPLKISDIQIEVRPAT